MPPQTRYAKSGDLKIAYQVVGEGPVDLVYVPGWVPHVELAWELSDLVLGFGRLASFSRLILFDKRGTGMSDPVPASELPTLEQRMDDVRAVKAEPLSLPSVSSPTVIPEPSARGRAGPPLTLCSRSQPGVTTAGKPACALGPAV